jgi:hypothetical protein
MKHGHKWLWYGSLSVAVLAACVLMPGLAQAQMTSVGIDCSQLAAIHALQQENMRVGLALMECGVIPRPSGATLGGDDDAPPAPPNVRVSNRDCSSNTSCTKSENMIWRSSRSGDRTVVDNFNDHNASFGGSYGGTSYSLDNGSTWTQIIPPPFASGHGQNFGDPIVVFNQKLDKWFAGDLASGCGGQGIGLWTSPDGINWSVVNPCVHSNSGDDRESMWVDNNVFSRAYGRMYISYNNFNVGGGALIVLTSNDGTTWTSHTLQNSFIRDVQVTGAPPGPPPPNVGYNSPVFVAAMDEMSGGLTTRQNHMFRSIDGGNTWTGVTMGPVFNAVGDGTCASNSYFARVFPIWRHMGWGEPGVGPGGVVHYAYAGQGTAAQDHGDIFYQRSADNGVTWSAPIKLNDDTGGQFKTQWMPSLSVNYNLAAFTPPKDVTVSWYDRRAATSACSVATDPGCSYERYGVQSTDNGATFGPNFAISDQLIPQPTQNDSGVQPCYAGDYDYDTAYQNTAYVTWTDGRRVVGGASVQDVEEANVPEP